MEPTQAKKSIDKKIIKSIKFIKYYLSIIYTEGVAEQNFTEFRIRIQRNE